MSFNHIFHMFGGCCTQHDSSGNAGRWPGTLLDRFDDWRCWRNRIDDGSSDVGNHVLGGGGGGGAAPLGQLSHSVDDAGGQHGICGAGGTTNGDEYDG